MHAALLALVLLAAPASAPAPLDGTWLFDDFRRSGRAADTELGIVWESTLAVRGDTFAVAKFLDGKTDYAGKLAFDPKQPTHVDIDFAAFDLTPLGAPIKIPAGPRPGVFKLDGDTLTLAFHRDTGGERPAAADAKDDKVMRATLKRAPAGFKGLPKEVKVSVTGPDGKPAKGVQLTSHVTFGLAPSKATADGKPTLKTPADRFAPSLGVLGTTGDDGTATAPYGDLQGGTLIAYDPAAKRIAYVPVTPATLAAGPVAVKLTPCREVTIPLACPEIKKLEYVNSTLHVGGRRVLFSASLDGKELRLIAPAGEYTLDIYADQVVGQKVALTIPDGDSPYTAVPVTLKANARALLVGKPAPELEGVVAVSIPRPQEGRKNEGSSVRLADYKGKYVILDFWGYWCGPCIESMPTWIAVHDKFQGKGVAVIGVHQDGDGEVSTVAEYDAKIEDIKKKHWEGRDLPFPVALVSGRDEAKPGPRKQYAISQWPTTLLIGPDGKVIGEFGHRDGKAAIAALEKLLEAKK